MQRDDLPSSHPPTSFKLIDAAPSSPVAYCQDKDKKSNNTILSPATNHNHTNYSFMRHGVVYPPIRHGPLFRGGGGPPALHSLILKQSTISTVAAGHAMKIPHKRTCMELGGDFHPQGRPPPDNFKVDRDIAKAESQINKLTLPNKHSIYNQPSGNTAWAPDGPSARDRHRATLRTNPGEPEDAFLRYNCDKILESSLHYVLSTQPPAGPSLSHGAETS
ncbi:Hypothetical protein FKW44_003343 [Caligus rogercresseyi]|uniref:Uncharacterized protein n=1 Tax=Caligus rogercresseyi TaxID=217165 RepID=A0A7T8QX11_CALRO|nr:Hypothetical protein FKW44_003343 [Caligus rogercresseyi]